MTYGSETRPLLVDVGLKFEKAEMKMIRWMGRISMKDRRTNEELRRLVGVEPITTVIRSGRLRWYVHVMRKSDVDWIKKCMEFRVERRRPVGIPRPWLESVEADMTELEIDKDMEKECYDEEVQPYRKTDYKTIIIVYIDIFSASVYSYWDVGIF